MSNREHAGDGDALIGAFRPSGEPPFYEPGQQILWREWCPGRRPGTPEVVHPMTVVRDDADGLVAWLAPDTPVMRAALPDGRDFRDAPLDERHRHPRSTKAGRWRGNGTLKIAPTGVPWSVWVFWNDDGSHALWYVNLEDVHVRDSTGIVTRDHELDVIVLPDGTTELKDDDELAAATEAGRFSFADATQYRDDAHAARELARAWASPFSDGWESWRPDPAWPVPTSAGASR